MPDISRPITHSRVMDLVRQAGLDIPDWTNPSDGKYCFNWSFIDSNKAVVLNLWYGRFTQTNGIWSQVLNLREEAMDFERKKRSRAAKLARDMDLILQQAFREKLPVRVIVLDGPMGEPVIDIRGNKVEEEAEVSCRELDPGLWEVSAYDWTSGRCIVVQKGNDPDLPEGDVPSPEADAPKPDQFVDQFTLQRSVSVKVFARSAEVRKNVLQRAQGKCELCQQSGFLMENGQIFLETHHVIPLSEGGPDKEDNVIALCPDHHREAHYGAKKSELRNQFQSHLANSKH